MPDLSFAAYMERFDARLTRYIPPRSAWNAADEALYGQLDLYRVPLAEAEAMQLRAIQYAFDRHYSHNAFYRGFCQERGISPADIKAPEDLARIPLLPDRFFKGYPDGRDFATWLGNVFTGDLPRVVIRKAEPSFDEVVAAFNAAGMVVSYSSGTGGRHTVIPRDQRTYLAAQYAAAKAGTTMTYPQWTPDIYGYLMMPNPHKTNVFAGKVAGIYFDAIVDVRVAIDRNISADVVRMTMSGQGGLRSAVLGYLLKLGTARMVDKIIRWLAYHRERGHKIAMVGAPFISASVMDKLEAQGRRFDLEGLGGILTGGGWKIYENRRVTAGEFRRRVQEILGISEAFCLDIYGMVEGNGWMIQCPEGHYLHAPYSYYKPLVVDADLKPAGYGQWGRFAFLDGAAYSYPGFIVTGDRVRMLAHCPVCDRPGPVLEPEVTRIVGEEMRGCGEEVRRMLSSDIGVNRD